jgi:hypothetical protein
VAPTRAVQAGRLLHEQKKGCADCGWSVDAASDQAVPPGGVVRHGLQVGPALGAALARGRTGDVVTDLVGYLAPGPALGQATQRDEALAVAASNQESNGLVRCIVSFDGLLEVGQRAYRAAVH